MTPFITLEEHFYSVEGRSQAQWLEKLIPVPSLAEKLADVGPIRLRSMDENNISMQVVSSGFGNWTVGQCVATNDQLARSIKASPDRFAGFAVLPVSDPQASAAELARCVRELGFVGALVDNRSGNTYFDGPEYDVMWAAAQELDVPVYLHPTWPSDEQKELLYAGNFSDEAAASLGSSAWGWHSDVALHVLRLFAAAKFDMFPRLKIIIGHMGEMLPFMLQRIMKLSLRWGERQRLFREVYDANIWITTSGVWSVDPMATILRTTKIDRILYSVDYPFARNEDGARFMQDLEASGLVDQDQLEAIAYKNAAHLLKIKPTKTF